MRRPTCVAPVRVAVLTPQVLSLVSGAYYTYVFHSYTKSGSEEWSTLKSHYAAGCAHQLCAGKLPSVNAEVSGAVCAQRPDVARDDGSGLLPPVRHCSQPDSLI